MRRARVPTTRPKPPTVRLRRLAAELRNLRSGAELSREDVEKRTGINEATLYRIETARARPQRRTLVALLDLYDVTDPQRSDLLAISRDAQNQGWLQPYHSELPEEYSAYISFEAEARSVRNYESLYIPGLLQTEDYTRAIIVDGLPTATQTEVEQRIQARLERQALLTRDKPLELWAIVDEAAIRRIVGGRDIMQAQLKRILEAAQAPNLTFQMIPYDKGAHPGMAGSFVQMGFEDPGDPELIFMDSLAGGLFLETDADIRRYKLMFEHLQAAALSPRETSAELAKAAKS
jgi:transcriptional regulator with XRE-family HTH domain